MHTPDLQSGSFYIWILTHILVEVIGFEPITSCVQDKCSPELSYTPILYTCGSVCPCKSDICMLSVWHVLCMILGFLRFNENNTITYIVTHNTDNCKTNAKITIRCTMQVHLNTAIWQTWTCHDDRMTYMQLCNRHACTYQAYIVVDL